jgi:hypothetical protein
MVQEQWQFQQVIRRPEIRDLNGRKVLSGKFARYASGLWMGALVGDDTLVAIAEYDYEYLPGYVDGNGLPQGKDNPDYRIYIIDRNDTLSQDYRSMAL